MSDVVGKFVEIPSSFSGEWRIPEFLSLPEEIDSFYCSDTFFFAGACWIFRMYPNGQTKFNSEGWITLFLIRKDTGPSLTLSYSVEVKQLTGMDTIISRVRDYPYIGESGWGNTKCLERTDLLSQKEDMLPSGVLTFTCRLKIKHRSSIEVSVCRRMWNMSQSLQGLLRSQEKADVTLKLEDGEVRAHRVILETRSEVFKRMFATDMRESQTGEVSVEEVDKRSFGVALAYVYSGEPAGLTSENASAVYRVAHKHDLRELVELCANFMQECLSVDTVCDFIAVAEVYQEAALKGRALDFFLNNAAEIVGTDQWKTLKMEKPALVSELLQNIVVVKADKPKTANC